MEVLCRGLLPQLQVAPLQEVVAYALSQPVSLVMIGTDSVSQLLEPLAAARDFQPLPAAAQRRLEEDVAPSPAV